MRSAAILDRITQLLAGQSLAAFCREIGKNAETRLNYETARKWFQRGQAPDTASLVKIARHFRADLQWLLGGERPATRLHVQMGNKLKSLRQKNGWTEERMGAVLGLTPRALAFYESGAWAPSIDLLQDFARRLGVPAEDLLHDGGTVTAHTPELKILKTGSAAGAPDLKSGEYLSIPLTESAIAAGQPIIQSENIEDYVLLHVRAAGKRRNLVASRVDGGSMEPALHSGDIVVIDRDDKRIAKNQIYAIFYDGGLTAKHIEQQKNLLILRPLNPVAQVQVVNLDEYPDPVVGRIIGAWKTF